MLPVAAEYYADTDTPISVFKRLETENFCFLLESAEGGADTARYSFIGRNPFLTFKSYGDKITVSRENGKPETITANPVAELERLAALYKTPDIPGMPQFCAGAVGNFAYDVSRLVENLPNTPRDDIGQPDMHFMFVDEIIAFDHKRQKLIIIVNMRTDGNAEDFEAEYERANRRIVDIARELAASPLPKNGGGRHIRVSPPASNFTKEEFIENVEKAKEYIRNGDIFQVVLSHRFAVETCVDPFNAYRSIRLINPSPYMYYLKFDGYQIAGASPEMLVRVRDGTVRTSPIAGTRKRGKTEEEDIVLENDLLADPKENAEHVMLVDLGRNDVGKVAEFGSVEVSRFKYLQRFSHVIHMSSDVVGKLKEGKTVFDALCAVLPAGTLSGAPKIRAMEIIDELENVKRGAYGGAIAYIGFNGSFDSCITIRTAVFKDGKAYIQAGAGIVYDSEPAKEYEETVNKAMAMLAAIEEAGAL
jgi:anthranilate synthase component 1